MRITHLLWNDINVEHLWQAHGALDVSRSTKKSEGEMQIELERSQPAEIEHSDIVRGESTQPVTFRASAPLLSALDALAAREHRTRANLIQHILWTYIHERGQRLKR